MASHIKKADFITSEEGIRITEVLTLMVSDSGYMTESSYSADSEKYSDNLIPFIDKHLSYLRSHPNMNPDHYLSNLRLMTRIRR